MLQMIAFFYVAVGVSLMFFPRAREEMDRGTSDVTVDKYPAWKVATFVILVYSVTVLFWPIYIHDWYSKKKSLWKNLTEISRFQEQKELLEAMAFMYEDGVDEDELPNGQGEFGMTSSNPIPCKTVFGSTAYLGRLRTPDGTKVSYKRICSVGSEFISQPIDLYEIFHPDGQKLAELFISPYQKRNSGKAPKGFVLTDNSLS